MSAIPGSVRVGGFIAPSDDTDVYPVTAEEYNRGGFRSVADQTARLAITAERRSLGMWVHQISDNTVWELLGGILNANWSQVVFGSTAAVFLPFYFADWVGPAIGRYTIIFTHNLDNLLVEVEVWDASQNVVEVERAILDANRIQLIIPSDPDIRFDGFVWIKVT